tara:strand:- start:155 stop:727 length:573 start_codon:yes stop_codon:yes gene_type:complete
LHGLLNSRLFLWILLYIALGVETYRYVVEISFYGEYLHWTAVQSARLIIFTLGITPLRLFLPKPNWVRWLVRRRRDIGVAAFVYGFAHTIAYIAYKREFALILEESGSVELWSGWVAMFMLLLLAVTSNDYSVRRLGIQWNKVHTLIYIAAPLVFLHWILTAFDPISGYIHLVVLAILLLLRLAPFNRQK